MDFGCSLFLFAFTHFNWLRCIALKQNQWIYSRNSHISRNTISMIHLRYDQRHVFGTIQTAFDLSSEKCLKFGPNAKRCISVRRNQFFGTFFIRCDFLAAHFRYEQEEEAAKNNAEEISIMRVLFTLNAIEWIWYSHKETFPMRYSEFIKKFSALISILSAAHLYPRTVDCFDLKLSQSRTAERCALMRCIRSIFEWLP